MTPRPHNLLHAVIKSTREVTTLGRERVLPWYKGKEIHHFLGVQRVTWTLFEIYNTIILVTSYYFRAILQSSFDMELLLIFRYSAGILGLAYIQKFTQKQL